MKMLKDVKAAEVLRIMRWVAGMDWVEFCAALELNLESDVRRDYWMEKYANIQRNLFRGLCEELDDQNAEKLWAAAVAKDTAFRSK
jgi:hypothetical protein